MGGPDLELGGSLGDTRSHVEEARGGKFFRPGRTLGDSCARSTADMRLQRDALRSCLPWCVGNFSRVTLRCPAEDPANFPGTSPDFAEEKYHGAQRRGPPRHYPQEILCWPPFLVEKSHADAVTGAAFKFGELEKNGPRARWWPTDGRSGLGGGRTRGKGNGAMEGHDTKGPGLPVGSRTKAKMSLHWPPREYP